MRFLLIGLSAAAVLAADFAQKHITVGSNGTVWFETIETQPVPTPETKLPGSTPAKIPAAPLSKPQAPAKENLPQGPELWDMSEYAALMSDRSRLMDIV